MHRPTVNIETFKTRTDFYGHWKRKEGGWFSAHPELKLEDFDIQDVTEPEPIEYALKSIKSTIEGMPAALMAKVAKLQASMKVDDVLEKNAEFEALVDEVRNS